MNILKVYKKILWFCICINNNIHNVVGTLVQYILKLEINYLQALSQLLVHAQLRIEHEKLNPPPPPPESKLPPSFQLTKCPTSCLLKYYCT